MKRHVPKRLWMYWHQGWENAPELVRRCAATWKRHNADWDIRLLDKTHISRDTELRSVVKGMLPTMLPTVQNISDIVRLHLLRRWGGVWVDATCWCMQPLDDWVESVSSRSGFFAFSRPASSRPISNWFLAASEDSRIIEMFWPEVLRLFEKTRAYIRHGGHGDLRPIHASRPAGRGYGELLVRTHDCPDGAYFWFHHLFQDVLDRNEEFRSLWESTPRMGAGGPERLQAVGLLGPATEEVVSFVENAHPPLFKLTHKIAIPADVSGTVLEVLYRSLDETRWLHESKPRHSPDRTEGRLLESPSFPVIPVKTGRKRESRDFHD